MRSVVSTARPAGVAGMAAVMVMSHPVLAVRATANLAEALTALRVGRVRHLVVVDDYGACVGILCDRAVAAAWAVDPIHFAATTVLAVLAPEPAVVPRKATIADVARAMRHHGTDAVVVVDVEGRPAGLVTAGDLVALLAKPSRSAAREA